MRHLTLLLLVGLLGFSACKKDEPDVNLGTTELLRLDGPNVTSPRLPAGFYEHAVKFPASQTSGYEGDLLTGVQVHLYNIPSQVEVVVYEAGASASAPGGFLYEGVVSGLTPNAVNDILFAAGDEILITNADLWIAIAYDTSVSGDAIQVVGCDAGPKNINGDFLKRGANWTTFEDFAGDRINWNIRGIVRPQ